VKRQSPAGTIGAAGRWPLLLAAAAGRWPLLLRR